MVRAIFIGRFQPLHLGHVKVIEWILSKVDELVIGIGSANESYTFRNPFTVGERIEMITQTLRKLGVLDRVYICSIPDTKSQSGIWYSYVKEYCPRFDIVYTNDLRTRLCLENFGFKVESTPIFDRDKYCGTKIRLMIAQGDETWKNLVPKEVVNFIISVGGVERIVQLAKIEGILK